MNRIKVTSQQEIRELLQTFTEEERSRILSEEIKQLPIEKRAQIVAQQLPVNLLDDRVNQDFSSSEEFSMWLETLSLQELTELIRAASETLTSQIKSKI